MPFRYKYCYSTFCATHRLPENHKCTSIKQTALPLSENLDVIDRNMAKLHQEENSTKTPKSSRNLILIAAVLCVITFALSWKYSYTVGYSAGFSKGFEKGETDAEKISKVTGYNEGFANGNKTGISDGYKFGYENGEYIGKDIGYQVGYDLGYEPGFHDGNQTGFTTSFQQGLNDIENRAFNLRNPTYSEVTSFLRKDQTDKEEYLIGAFICDDYSRTVKNNAFYYGIHCFYVSLKFPEPPGHALIAFNTTDRGLVFFEPQSDDEMDVEVGIRYWRDNGRYKIDYDDTIVRLELIW